MLTPMQEQAVDLLFEGTLEEAAARLGIKVQKLRQWMDNEDFRKVLEKRSDEKRQSARRIAVQAALLAAQALEAAAESGDEKGFCKTSVDILKAVGAFTDKSEAATSENGDGADALDKLIQMAEMAEGDSGESDHPCREEE